MSETSNETPGQGAPQGAGAYRVLARRYRPSTFAELSPEGPVIEEETTNP